MSVVEYTTVFEMFNEANKILGEEMFNIYGVGYEKKVTTGNIDITLEHNFECEDKPDIIIIPGGIGSEEAVKDKYIIKFILSKYNSCDYLLSINTGVYFLSRCRMLDGILVPKITDAEEKLKASLPEIMFTEKAFVDNGKIIISSNILGSIEGCLNIIKKVAGQEAFLQLIKVLGIK